MEKQVTIYRVRKSAQNLKSQKGAFFIFENAVNVAKRTKCNVYDNERNCVWNYK